MRKIGIIGAGTWGMALAIYLANLGNEVKVWSNTEEEKDIINNEKRCKNLPKAIVPKKVLATTSYKEAIEGTEIILHVTPSKFVRENVVKYKQFVTNQPIVMCSKGFESSTLCTLAEVLEEELPRNKIGVLSGPSHAEEVSLNVPTAIVAASKDGELLKMMQEIFMSKHLRIYISRDVKGVELGGALKNIIAFCAGAVAGLGMGDNTFAALITRGLAEISRLGVELGGAQSTFYGLAGLGDLIVTCMSEHSRNRRAGVLIGQGKTLEETRQIVGMTIESIDNIEIAYRLAKKYNVNVPIIDTVYDVLYNNLEPKKAVEKLMTREPKTE
ncbi:MAG: NAD(P)-dependent glycerol-3-phosphate dehydrogenase [Oscillospiraceae bacterium]|nr:NAD(P)-dependent glycerol-3-phosphate dehydrogenase [Oscillospiraceae bacterium]